LVAAAKKMQDELELIVQRKERYVTARDDAKDKLAGNFEQARLFFRSCTVNAIVQFVKFEQVNGSKELRALPPMDDWRLHATKIFDEMRKEIQNDEKKVTTPTQQCSPVP
jgi:hypothetical protein